MRAKTGTIKQVQNKQPKPAANKEYYAVWVQFSSGCAVPLLLTDNQFCVASDRARKNPEDLPRRRFGLIKKILGR